MSPLSPELTWLAASALLTGILWIPYVANRIRELGPPGWAWFPPVDPPPRAAWAARAVRAHLNAVENLTVFAPLALAVELAQCGSPVTALACRAYFLARSAHAIVTFAGLPIPLRTLAFLVGFAAQLALAGVLLLRVSGG